MNTNISFLDSFYDPGPHENGRYLENMLPELEKKDSGKAHSVSHLKRQHALIVMADSLHYTKFRNFCKMVDPGGIANWFFTHVDWSARKWHPTSYRAQDITFDLLMNITSIKVSITCDNKHEEQQHPCLWNGAIRPCYLFARKFYPECLDKIST